MRTRSDLRLLLPWLALTLGACATDESRPDSPLVRDSAGVQIVENAAPRWPEGEGWRLSDRPILEIGVLEGDPEYQLYRVSGAVRLDDGRIVVANSGTSELRFYDPSGAFLISAGREGEGPGEFRGLWQIQEMVGDSLLTYDFRNRRISIFTADGRFARSFTPQSLVGSLAFPDYVAAFADGTIMLGLESPSAEEIRSGVQRRPITYVLCDAGGALIDTLGQFAGTEWYTRSEGEGEAARILMGTQIFGRSPEAAIRGDGFYYGSGDAYEIHYYGVDGVLSRVIRLDQPNLAVTTDDIERYKEWRLERARSDEDRVITERLLAHMPFPETMPAYDEFMVDSEGNLWVDEYRRLGDDQPRWKVFDPQGALLGVVETPMRFNIFQIGPDFVLGRWVDDLDVEYVQLYALRKQPAEP